MNRRNRKKKETGLFDVFKEKLTQLDMSRVKSHWLNFPVLHRRALMVLVPFVVILILIPAPEADVSDEIDSVSVSEPVRTEIEVNPTSLSEEGENKMSVTTTDAWQEYTVQSGDTLAKVFRANDLSMADLNALIAIEGLDKPLSKIKAGQLVRFKLAAEGHLDILQLEKSGTSVMFFRLSDGGYGRSK